MTGEELDQQLFRSVELPSFLDNPYLPRIDQNRVSEFREFWRSAGGEDASLDMNLKHTRVVTPELRSEHKDLIVQTLQELVDSDPNKKITIVTTGGRSGMELAEWFDSSEEPGVQKLKENPRIDWKSLDISAQKGSEYVDFVPSYLYDDSFERTIVMIGVYQGKNWRQDFLGLTKK